MPANPTARGRPTPHVLIVDDDANAREAIAALVEAEGYTVAQAGDLREARIQLVRQQPQAVLIDLHLPDGRGLELLDDLEDRIATEIVLITGNASVDSAVGALRAGAADYLTKPLDLPRLKSVLARLRQSQRRRDDLDTLRNDLRLEGYFGLMLGQSPAMRALYGQITRVAPTDATVLLIGESGTGKELAAQTLHAMSKRARRPFMAVNCGAISPNLIESEMFGHERGSFTGADRQHQGYFERADGGTLFLDEVTEMPPELQVKLLRVLETGRFMRIGTDREIGTNVRVIAATNREPEAAVADGRFRVDLYHRLNVFPLRMPPLREREGDVELLAQTFLTELNETRGTAKTFSPAALKRIAAHGWPGNVRELRNHVQRAYILSDAVIEADLPLQTAMSPSQPGPGGSIEIPIGSSMAEAEKQLILATYEQCGGVKKYTAAHLGISLKTLYSRLQEYGVGVEATESDGDEKRSPGS